MGLTGESEVTASAPDRSGTGQRLTAASQARLLESAPIALLVLDAAGRIVFANTAAEALFGYAADELLDQALAGLVPDGIDFWYASGTDAADHWSRATPLGAEGRHKDGSRFPVELAWSTTAIGDEHLVTVAVRDVSERRRAQREREEWISVIAHDLRQPVSVIKGFAALVQLEVDRHDDLRRVSPAVGHIRSAATHLSKMISDLLDSSLLDADRLVINRVPVSLQALVEAAGARAAEAVPSRIVLQIESPLPNALVDPGRIEQVLSNLIANGDKYGFPDSEILVRARVVGDAVEISVTNRGPGIAPDEVATLFDRFWRSRFVESSGIEGLGLGLNISRGLVEAHGGRIWVESIPGETTTFTFTIPTGAIPIEEPER